MNSHEIRFFVKTTKKNYAINLMLSFLTTALISYTVYLKRSLPSLLHPFLAIAFLLIFILSYRVTEFITTKKTIFTLSQFFFILGDEREYEEAYRFFYIYLGGLIMFALIFLFAGGK